MAAQALHLPAGDPRAVCVLVHGRGQSPEEMQAHVLARLDAPDVAHVLPRAEGGSWYAAKAVDPLTADTRAALDAALDQLGGDIAAARAAHPGLPLLLAGFSQGACLALEYACSGRPAPDALVALTGCRVGAPQDDRPRALPEGMAVLLTGSDDDPWIPVAAFADAAHELGRQKARLRAELFPGRGHEVSDAEITLMGDVLAGLMGARSPQGQMAAPA